LVLVVIVLVELVFSDFAAVVFVDLVDEFQVTEDSPEETVETGFVEFAAIAEEVVKELNCIFVALVE
jgi:hypothetical protein